MCRSSRLKAYCADLTRHRVVLAILVYDRCALRLLRSALHERRVTRYVAQPFAERQGGFSLVSAIFILVVLAVLAAGIVKLSTTQHASASLDLQGVRAYQAARAGVEWGIYRILNPDAAPSVVLPSCWGAAETLPLAQDLASFTVAVSCLGATTTELNRSIGVYRISAVATFGATTSPYRVSRTVEATVSKCIDPANTPTYEC
ncbi:MAG TPA: hypothetical protein VFA81_05850 [Burkholderiales bacterium]|nr:hypothetical protein [Burkholderiales bacterium]